MATIIDPNGTISVVYREPSVTVQSVNATGTTGGGATLLEIFSATNVILVTTSASNTGVKLPAAEAGDRFEIFKVAGAPALVVYDNAGDEIASGQLRFDGTNWRS